jgi:AraC-like DNA-binding protein
VLSYLPPLLAPRLSDAVRDVGAEHLRANSWTGLEQTIRKEQVAVMVVDPYVEHTVRARDIARLMRSYPSMPVIAYTQFVPVALRALSLLAKRGLHESVLFQFDDGRARFGRLLVRASTRSMARQMLDGLEDARQLLAPQVADAIDDLFERPHAYTSARDLVITSGTPLTSLYRAFYGAGLEPPKRLFIAARVLHALSYLRDPGYTVQQVADKMGYRHPRVLTQHTLSVFGIRPSALRRHSSSDELVGKLVDWVKRA